MHTTTSTITIKAPKAKVWDALTKPDLVKQWQYGSAVATTWEPGSRISFRSEWHGQVFEQWGTVIEFSPPEHLSYSLFAPRPDLKDSPENYFQMSYKLDEQDGVTLLTITQNDPRPAAGESNAGEAEAENAVLKALKAVAEAL